MYDRGDVSESHGLTCESPLKEVDAKNVYLTRFKRLLIGILVLGIAIALYLPTPHSSHHACIWERYVGLMLLAAPCFLILFCKSVTFCTGWLRVGGRFAIFAVVAVVGWKLTDCNRLACYYCFPNMSELRQQLENPNVIVYEENAGEKVVALTFDDGPVDQKTDAILDVLRDEGVHATFFLCGRRLEGLENVLKREVQEGHEVGNHSWSHTSLSECLPSRLREELGQCNNAIYAITGKKPVLARPPYGAINLMGVHYMQEYGLTPVFWTVCTCDWLHKGDDSVLEIITSYQQPYVPIVLMHDCNVSPQALRRVVQWYRQQGYRFVTISELLELRRRDK